MIMISSSYLISKLCFETRSPSQVVFNTFISFFILSQIYIFPSYNRLNVNLSYKLLNVQLPKLQLSSIHIFPSYNRLNVNLSYKLPQVETFLNIQFPKLQPLKCKFKLQPSNGTISQVKSFQMFNGFLDKFKIAFTSIYKFSLSVCLSVVCIQ